MVDVKKIQKGMQVFGENDQPFGKIERINGQEFYINGKSYPVSAFSRLEQNKLYLAGNQQADANYQDAATLNVPVIEEQLNVGKRQVQLGEVELKKTVTQEQVNIPVELRREEVHVQETNVTNRPLSADEANQAFQEGTIRVPVRGEEAVVSKQAVITGEVVVNKGVVAEQQQISDTVRKERVTVDNDYAQAAPPVQTKTVTRQVETPVQTKVATRQVETQMVDQTNVAAVGSDTYVTESSTETAGSFDQTHLEEDMEVYSSDDHHLGKVKEVTGSYFLVGRGLFKGNIEANFSSIQQVEGDKIILNLTKDQVDALS